MTEEHKEKFWDSIVKSSQVRSNLLKRKKSEIFESIYPELRERYENEGWILDRKFKTKVKMKKAKSFDLAFEDKVWSTICGLGFGKMNKDRNFKMPYSDDFELTQQINVFAADDETILLVECKATEEESKKGNFKEVIEEIGGKKEDILKALKKLFPDRKHKVKFILATKNYVLSKPDQERLENFGILHFDEEVILYYEELTKHLGVSARFQLLGNLFEGQDIPEIQNKIPAIEGKMGGHTYYSFSIEPEKLLKIGYVLHRNKANKKLIPTYQRLIKRSRLLSVQEFVEDGGFFPNSIIINITTNSKKLQFDKANTQVDDAISRIGVLHLPKKYRSAFIIDGQHRLYGYANSEYKSTNSIPVVAFLDLDRWDQVRIFKDINEKQKAVHRSLKNDLEADLNYDSKNPKDRINALKLFIAKSLGEDIDSPLFDRVQFAGDQKTKKRCISTETIKLGLNRTNFFPLYSKNKISQNGSFFRGDNDTTLEYILPYLIGSFSYIAEALPEDWDKGEDADGYLSINAGIESLLRIFNDIVDHLINQKVIDMPSDTTDKILDESKYYLDPLISHLKKLTSDEKLELKKSYGTGLKARYWRILQREISNQRENFKPEGLEKYWNDEAKRFNTESIEMIRDIETHFKEDFKTRLFDFYGENWFEKGVHPDGQDSAVVSAQRKNRKNPSERKEPWDCLNIIDYRKIAIYGANWRDIFEKHYTKPNPERKGDNKEEKTKWMQKLEGIRNVNFHEYSVKEDEYEFLKELHEWLVENRSENELE